MERPWAVALLRLLTERHLKKGELAELCDMRAGTISAVLNSARPPDIRTLQRLIAGFDKWSTLHPRSPLPRVQLWEFFVSDEESALLRDRRKQIEQLNAQPEDPRRALFEQFLAFTEGRLAAPDAQPARPRVVPNVPGGSKKR